MKLQASMFLVLAVTSACRTGGNAASVKDVTPPAPPPAVVLAGGMGTAAAAIYDATTIAEANDAGTMRKSVAGRLIVHCALSGALPPGAQGFPGPSKYSCAANAPLPPGAQGLPAPAFMHVDGDAAQAFYTAFAVEATYLAASGSYEKVYSADDAAFECAKTGGNYRCAAGTPASIAKATAPSTTESMSLMGGRSSAAGLVFDALKAKVQMVSGVETKSVTGRLSLTCAQTSAKAAVCVGSYPLPPGAQGIPGQPFLHMDGPAAVGLFEAMRVPAQGKEKTFKSDAGELTCTKGGNGQFGCTLRGQPG